MCMGFHRLRQILDLKDALRVHLENTRLCSPYENATSGILQKQPLTMHEPFAVEVGPSFFLPAST